MDGRPGENGRRRSELEAGIGRLGKGRKLIDDASQCAQLFEQRAPHSFQAPSLVPFGHALALDWAALPVLTTTGAAFTAASQTYFLTDFSQSELEHSHPISIPADSQCYLLDMNTVSFI